jgi:uncharacterized protein YndB with AHSA1/START domain
MPIRKERSGRRSVQVEVEVPGTPEQVWQAIGTGAGISSWFVPATLEERVGGKLVCSFGPGMDSTATITAWNPPHYSAAESRDLGASAANAPTLATEWFVEARAGGTCVVRVVHSLFASTDDWDTQLTDTESGWPTFFQVLRLVLTHFPGQACSAIHELSMPAGPESQVWDKLAGALGVAGGSVGQRCRATAGVPPMAGIIEQVGQGAHQHKVVLRLEEPAPGVGLFYSFPCGGPVMASIHLHLFGESARAVVARDAPLWRAWMDAQFPTATPATSGASCATG